MGEDGRIISKLILKSIVRVVNWIHLAQERVQ
jgi:hypothetical protein